MHFGYVISVKLSDNFYEVIWSFILFFCSSLPHVKKDIAVYGNVLLICILLSGSRKVFFHSHTRHTNVFFVGFVCRVIYVLKFDLRLIYAY